MLYFPFSETTPDISDKNTSTSSTKNSNQQIEQSAEIQNDQLHNYQVDSAAKSLDGVKSEDGVTQFSGVGQVGRYQEQLLNKPTTLQGVVAGGGAIPQLAGVGSLDTNQKGIRPIAPYETVLEPNLLDRSLRIRGQFEESEFLHDQLPKFTFNASSEHENGFSGRGKQLTAVYVSYIKVETDGTYTFSSRTKSDKSRHTVAIYLNDSQISEQVQSSTTSAVSGHSASTISRSVVLVRGIYKIDTKVAQDYSIYDPVEMSLQIKGQSNSSMVDFTPSLISANQPMQPSPIAQTPQTVQIAPVNQPNNSVAR